MRRRDIPAVLLASTATAAPSAPSEEPEPRSSVGYPRTAAEIAAKVTPLNLAFPPMWPERYGTNTRPGETLMTQAVQAAIDVARAGGGTVVLNGHGQPWPYLVTAPLDCTPLAGKPIGFTIRCEGHMLADTDNPPYYASILARHDGVAVFDCTGSYGINFENVAVGTDLHVYPQTCFFIARAATGNSQIHRFTNCRVLGRFSVACLYNYGSEDGVYAGCYMANHAGTPGTSVVCLTGNNVHGLKSRYGTVAKGAQSTLEHSFVGGQYHNKTADARSDVFYLEGNVLYCRLYGQWAACANDRGAGRSIIYCDTRLSPPGQLYVSALEGENTNVYPQYGIYVGGGSNIAAGYRLDGCYLPHRGAYMECAAGQDMQELCITNPYYGQLNGGYVCPGATRYSSLQTHAMKLTMGKSLNNHLVGRSEVWTVSARVDDNWTDTGTANKTWTPDTSHLSVSGTLAVTDKRMIIHDSRVTVTVALSVAGGLIGCRAGAILGGLPLSASSTSCDVKVVDSSTLTQIGCGVVREGSTGIVLPRIPDTANTIVVTATYFAA